MIEEWKDKERESLFITIFYLFPFNFKCQVNIKNKIFKILLYYFTKERKKLLSNLFFQNLNIKNVYFKTSEIKWTYY